MITEKEYVFFLHYNHPESRKQKKPIMTVHYKDACNFVDNIHCDTVTFGYIKEHQPRWVIKGKTDSFEIINGVAFIRNSNSDVSSKANSGFAFKFHYNKSESNIVGKPQINLIFRGETYIVDNIICNVPVWSETKRKQFTLNGKAQSMKVEDGIAHLD